jgi:hypothetical protein
MLAYWEEGGREGGREGGNELNAHCTANMKMEEKRRVELGEERKGREGGREGRERTMVKKQTAAHRATRSMFGTKKKGRTRKEVRRMARIGTPSR